MKQFTLFGLQTEYVAGFIPMKITLQTNITRTITGDTNRQVICQYQPGRALIMYSISSLNLEEPRKRFIARLGLTI